MIVYQNDPHWSKNQQTKIKKPNHWTKSNFQLKLITYKTDNLNNWDFL